MTWNVLKGDCLEVMAGMEPDSVDLVFFSPPYENARTYSIGFDLRGQAWVDWMVKVFTECRRICTGLVACVCEGMTRKFRWSATPALLMADLHRAGFHLRKPPAFHRVGIPGSGGPDWFRNDYEFIVCTTRSGKLPWSDNTAMGHKPKWALGGEMSYRSKDGSRRNEWGATNHATGMAGRYKNGKHKPRKRPQHDKNGTVKGGHDRNICKIANPGNVIRCKVGGGLMGSDLAHENEAPFPEALAEWFIRSAAKPGGTVLDPTCGSGTTVSVAHRLGRHGIGIDVRQSQVDLTRRRLEGVTTEMFV